MAPTADEDELGPHRIVIGVEEWEVEALQAARALRRASLTKGTGLLELRALEGELVRLVTRK